MWSREVSSNGSLKTLQRFEVSSFRDGYKDQFCWPFLLCLCCTVLILERSSSCRMKWDVLSGLQQGVLSGSQHGIVEDWNVVMYK